MTDGPSESGDLSNQKDICSPAEDTRAYITALLFILQPSKWINNKPHLSWHPIAVQPDIHGNNDCKNDYPDKYSQKDILPLAAFCSRVLNHIEDETSDEDSDKCKRDIFKPSVHFPAMKDKVL